ncbi:MAG: heparan-alpha-glucosaminide N-acetyltransferase [Planctomycetes bacterium]|nr:heparan-alpha-glucosaminide N-acetyltransferase [Planctomycetota bacterium]
MQQMMARRSMSLDVARGLTVLLMILVNHPGSWGAVYAPLRHASWNGVTPTDFVFPNFLFLVGVSMAISLGGKRRRGEKKGAILLQAAIRAAKLFALGLFLWLFPDFDWGGIRWPGVLQRIAICFLLATGLSIFLSTRWQVIVSLLILVLYAIVLFFVPVPGTGGPLATVGPSDLSRPGMNFANYLDSILLPGVMWEGTWDPEGLLSTLPALVTTMLGMMLAPLFLSAASSGRSWMRLFVLGGCMLAIGIMSSQVLPLNKHIWTSSYVPYMAGCSTLFLAALIVFVDHFGWRRPFYPALVFGTNAILAYVLAGILTIVFYSDRIVGLSLSKVWMGEADRLGLAPEAASIFYASFYVAIILALIIPLYRRRIFLKL